MRFLFVAVALGAAALVTGCGGGERVGRSNAAAPERAEENADATDASSTEASDASEESADAAPESDAAQESEAAAPDGDEQPGAASEPQ